MFIVLCLLYILIFLFQMNHKKRQISTSSKHNNRFQINFLAVKPFGIISDSQSKANCLSQLWGSPRGMITANYLLFSDLNFHHKNSIRNFNTMSFLVLCAVSPFKLAKVLTNGGVKIPWCVGTHRTALSWGHLGVLTLQHILTLDFIAKDGSIVTDTDLARGGLPNIPVQVHLSTLSAGYFFTIFSWNRGKNIQHIFQHEIEGMGLDKEGAHLEMRSSITYTEKKMHRHS